MRFGQACTGLSLVVGVAIGAGCTQIVTMGKVQGAYEAAPTKQTYVSSTLTAELGPDRILSVAREHQCEFAESGRQEWLIRRGEQYQRRKTGVWSFAPPAIFGLGSGALLLATGETGGGIANLVIGVGFAATTGIFAALPDPPPEPLPSRESTWESVKREPEQRTCTEAAAIPQAVLSITASVSTDNAGLLASPAGETTAVSATGPSQNLALEGGNLRSPLVDDAVWLAAQCGASVEIHLRAIAAGSEAESTLSLTPQQAVGMIAGLPAPDGESTSLQPAATECIARAPNACASADLWACDTAIRNSKSGKEKERYADHVLDAVAPRCEAGELSQCHYGSDRAQTPRQQQRIIKPLKSLCSSGDIAACLIGLEIAASKTDQHRFRVSAVSGLKKECERGALESCQKGREIAVKTAEREGFQEGEIAILYSRCYDGEIEACELGQDRSRDFEEEDRFRLARLAVFLDRCNAGELSACRESLKSARNRTERTACYRAYLRVLGDRCLDEDVELCAEGVKVAETESDKSFFQKTLSAHLWPKCQKNVGDACETGVRLTTRDEKQLFESWVIFWECDGVPAPYEPHEISHPDQAREMAEHFNTYARCLRRVSDAAPMASQAEFDATELARQAEQVSYDWKAAARQAEMQTLQAQAQARARDQAESRRRAVEARMQYQADIAEIMGLQSGSTAPLVEQAQSANQERERLWRERFAREHEARLGAGSNAHGSPGSAAAPAHGSSGTAGSASAAMPASNPFRPPQPKRPAGWGAQGAQSSWGKSYAESRGSDVDQARGKSSSEQEGTSQCRPGYYWNTCTSQCEAESLEKNRVSCQ